MRPLLGIFRAWLNLRSTVPLRLFMHLWMILQEVPKPKMMLWESYRKSMLEKLAAKVGCSCCPSSCPAGRILRLFGQSIHQLLARWDFHFQTLEKHCEVPWSFLSGKALWQESELPALPAVLWCLGLRILDRLWTFIGFFFFNGTELWNFSPSLTAPGQVLIMLFRAKWLKPSLWMKKQLRRYQSFEMEWNDEMDDFGFELSNFNLKSRFGMSCQHFGRHCQLHQCHWRNTLMVRARRPSLKLLKGHTGE